MSNLGDVVAYLCRTYPYKHELSKARVTKMVYLADWRSALSRGRQLTDIAWRFHHYGPWTDAVYDAATATPSVQVKATTNVFGSPKDLIVADPDATWTSLTEDDQKILDHVITETRDLYWDDFIKLVYSTYPVLSQERYSRLDLATLADDYESEQAAAR